MRRSNAPYSLVVLCATLLAGAAAEAQGATIDVPGDQPTIQAAVDAAGPGETIRVAPGDYFESVLVSGAKDGLTIEAADAAAPPVIHGTPNVSQDGIRVDRVDGVTIRNVHIIGAYDGVRLNNARGALLMGLYVEDNALGVRVYQGQDNRVVQCTVVHTRVEQGILVDSSDRIVLAQNFVTDAAFGGIRVRDSPCAVLDANQVIDNRGSDGIKVEDCDGARVRGCTASGSYRHGFLLASSPDLVLIDNTADDNRSSGLRVDGCSPFETVADVAAGGNGGSGNPQGAIVVVPPPPGSGGAVVCEPVETPTPPSGAATPTPPTSGDTAQPTPQGTATGGAPGHTPAPPGTATIGPTPGGTPAPTPSVTATAPVPTPVPTPVPSDPVRCQRAVARAGAAFAKARVSALKSCAERLLKGTLGPDPGPGARLDYCRTKSRAAARIAKARAKLGAAIDLACGGPNGTCGDGDDNLDVQLDLGFPPACPDLDRAGCVHVLTDCRAAAACLGCIHDAAIDRAIAVSYDGLVALDPAAPSTALAKCRQTIGKETTKYLLARAKALGKCWHDRFKGKHADPCPAVETQVQIRRADARRIAKICRVCGGSDAACDQWVTTVDPGTPPFGGSAGADDLTPGAIGFAPTCPNVTVPANVIHDDAGCGGPVETLADLVFCAGCVTEFVVDCGDRSGVQPLVPYPAACSAPAPAPVPTLPEPTP